jgi:hypothetical protein
MRSRRAFSLFALVLLSGCASSTAQFPGLIAPSAGKAVVYIYRVDFNVGAVRVAPHVRVNYENIGPLMRSGYFRVEVDPGPTQVALYRLDKGDTAWGDDTFWRAAQDAIVNLKLAPNSTHFIEFTLDRFLFSFRETSRDRALRSLPDLYLLN